jgi:hypothetical protein
MSTNKTFTPPKAFRTTRWAQIADDMGIGDSRIVANNNEAAGLKHALKNRGKKGSQRLEPNWKVRVWRVE